MYRDKTCFLLTLVVSLNSCDHIYDKQSQRLGVEPRVWAQKFFKTIPQCLVCPGSGDFAQHNTGIKNVPQHHWIEKNREITEKWKLFWSAQSSKNLHTIFLSKLSRASLFPNVSKAKNQSNTYPSRINMFSTLCSEHRRALHRLVPAFKQFTKSKGRREVHKHNQVRSRSGLVPCECWKSPTTVACQGLFRWRHY